MSDEWLAEDETRLARAWSVKLPMQLAQDGETLRLAAADCVTQLGPAQPGWVRFAEVRIIDLPPETDSPMQEGDDQ